MFIYKLEQTCSL